MKPKIIIQFIIAGMIGCFYFGWGTNSFAAPLDLSAESNNQNLKIEILQALKFDLPGTTGFYRELQCGRYLIKGSGQLRIEFSASPLYYTDPAREKTALTVIYWVNEAGNDRFSFKPGSPPLRIYRNFGGHRAIEFIIYGGITIGEVIAQPAGRYEGGVRITACQ